MSYGTTSGYEKYLRSMYGGKMSQVEAERKREAAKVAREKMYATLALKGGDLASKFQKSYMDKKYMGKAPYNVRIGGDAGFDMPMDLPTGRETDSSGIFESLRRGIYGKPSDYTPIDYSKTENIKPIASAMPYTPPVDQNFAGVLSPEDIDKILEANISSTGTNLHLTPPVGSGSGGLLANVKSPPVDVTKLGTDVVTDVGTDVVSATGDASSAWSSAIPYLGTVVNALQVPFQGSGEKRKEQTWKTGGSLLSTLILTNLDKIAALMAGLSDRRLKENIDLVGHSDKGLNIYQWNYKGLPEKRFEGVMADEVPEEARITYEGGLQAVDYAKIDVDMRRVN